MSGPIEAPAAADAPTFFEGKYLETGGVGLWLVDRFFRSVRELLEPLTVESVLEVGCGAGHSTTRLRRMLPEEASLAASDVNADNVARARRLVPDVPVTVESIYHLDRPDRSVDVVVCLEVLEHLDDPAAALKEIARVARRGAVLSVPREPIWRMLNLARGAYWRRGGDTPGHVQHWSGRGFARFVSTALHVKRVRRPLPWTLLWATVPSEMAR